MFTFFPRAIFLGSLSYSYPFFHFPAKKFLSCYRWIFISPLTLTFQSLFAVDQRHESISAIYRHLLTAFLQKKKKKKISFLIIDSVHDNISKTPISFVNFKGFMQSLRSQGCYRVPEEENSREDRISHLESLFTSRGAVPGRGEAAHHFQPEFLRQGLQSRHIQKGHSGRAAASIHRSRVITAKWSGGSHNL